ncbi:TetR/AcrR family transcriptional regulator [Pseudonocardia ailaonensis]|uniref:TetR/AcrR family transcriptional regulator n=1 Tax=Pseudonocardia ailaonensis TaxID=367279 RepID=A0ABN2NI19_9PSEU
MDVLWDSEPAPARGPRRGLTREGIARAAIALADAEGLESIAMQRVAAALGVTKMALYRYVPGKAELVALMVDVGIGPVPDIAGTGRAALEAWSRALHAVFARHPWATTAVVGPRAVGPHELRWTERALAALAGTPFTGGEKLDAVAVLAGHVRAIAQQGAEEEIGQAMGAVLAARAGEFPEVSAAFADPGERNAALDFGLARILDGIDAEISRRS